MSFGRGAAARPVGERRVHFRLCGRGEEQVEFGLEVDRFCGGAGAGRPGRDGERLLAGIGAEDPDRGCTAAVIGGDGGRVGLAAG